MARPLHLLAEEPKRVDRIADVRDIANMPRRVLIVESDESARRQLHELLGRDRRLVVDSTGDASQALDKLQTTPHSIVITELRMPGEVRMELIDEVKNRALPVTVIVTTGHGSIDDAVHAIRLGAYDFLTKPIDVDNLRLVLQRALSERALQDEVAYLRSRLQDNFSFHNILSKSPHMLAVFELIEHVAQSNTNVLIEGETGTGKELVARALHEASPKHDGPLVAVNCAALPETLLESELFGHERGAFTGAAGMRRGRFEIADGGTLFLDEVGDVPPSMQAKLLRVLQERRFERVGGSDLIEVDVHLVAATNRSLKRLVKQGKFREDLYYRLNVVKIDLPPLRERVEDIPLLAAHFAEKYARPGDPPKHFAPAVMEILLNYRWPGNIRELENAIERASITSINGTIEVENLPPEIVTPAPVNSPFPITLDRRLPELVREAVSSIERQYIRLAMRKAHGNVGRCAQVCGLSRRSITAKIAAYNLDKAAFKTV